MPLDLASEPTFGQLTRQMNKMMEQVQKGFFCLPAETWTPNVNVYENDAAYVVCVDLAGVDKERIDLTLIDNELRLRGVRAVPAHPDNTEETPGARWRVHLMEIDHGAFCRTVELPHNVQQSRIRANYRNGLLWIEIPKA
jgi:HSP20 family protein